VTDDRVVRVPPLNVWTKVLRGEVGVTGELCMCVRSMYIMRVLIYMCI
jgi:hypothetical protein